jgi:dihydroflavonol-4-reductase
VLARDPGRVEPVLRPHGVGPGAVEAVAGDVRDAESVARAARGCDAVLHAAAVYSFDPRRAEEIRATNVEALDGVLGACLASGAGPVVHVSSYVALLPSADVVLHPDGPLGEGAPGPYLRSKSRSEAVARARQDAGEPVVVVQPGSVWGPLDPGPGESARIARDVLGHRMPVFPRGGVPLVDVRDLAPVLARATRVERPARYLVGGTYLDTGGLVRGLAAAAGRRVPTAYLPAGALGPAAWLADVAQRALPMRLPVPSGAIWAAGQAPRTDDSRARDELGFRPRPVAETLRDTVGEADAA